MCCRRCATHSAPVRTVRSLSLGKRGQAVTESRGDGLSGRSGSSYLACHETQPFWCAPPPAVDSVMGAG